MALISLDNLDFDYGREPILRGLNLALEPNVRCGLVGANGAGKTTLLSALAGELDLPSGTRSVSGRVSIAVLRQESTLAVDDDLQTGLRDRVEALAFAHEKSIAGELEDIARRLQTNPDADTAGLVQRQGHLQAEFERLGGYGMQARLEAALTGVGLPEESWQRPLGSLSGGERRRAALAVVLLRGADLLLLDEPTNHLDLESCEWLEGFLSASGCAAVIVSHDRHFLDRVTTRTLHLDRGTLVNYAGNYSFFMEQSLQRYQQDLAAWERQQARIRQTEEYIRRNIEGQNTRQAQSRRKQLAKEERLVRPTPPSGLFRFKLRAARNSGGTVFQVEGLGRSVSGRTLIAGLDLHVSRGERIGILGPNGCGKSTLLKMLTGSVIPDAGRIVVGQGVDIGYYDQELSLVSDHNTVLSEMETVDPAATIGELRSFLGAFGFGEDLFDRQVARLSGGERGRLALMRLMKEGHNTLLLDEPTNHLDARSRESLESALKAFDGTLIVVSHDRRFLESVVHRLLVFPARGEDRHGSGQVRDFAGSYSEWAAWRRREAEMQGEPAPRKAAAPTPSSPRPGSGGLSKNEVRRREMKIREIEERILVLEEEQGAAVATMGAPGTTSERRLELGLRCQEIESELAACLEQWEALHGEIEAGTGQAP